MSADIRRRLKERDSKKSTLVVKEYEKHRENLNRELGNMREKSNADLRRRLGERKGNERKKKKERKNNEIETLEAQLKEAQAKLSNVKVEDEKVKYDLEAHLNEVQKELSALKKSNKENEKDKIELEEKLKKKEELFHTTKHRLKESREKVKELEKKKCPPCVNKQELDTQPKWNIEDTNGSWVGGKKTRRKRRKRKKKKTRRKRKRKGTKKKKKSKRGTKKTITRKDKCAPKGPGETLDFTCYTKNSLNHMKDLWNARHKDALINTSNPKEIWRQLGENMKNTCNRESCWLKQKWTENKLDKKVKNNTFAPTQPSVWKKKPNEWLTSIDILNVMRQYEEKYPDFEFLGPSPIDFDTHKMHGECVWDELCKFSLKKTKDDGVKKVGIIFNLDPHNKPGSHWVAAYINMYKKEIYYFDSYGDRTPSKIKTFVKRVAKESKHFGKKYNFKVNKRRHQYSDSECGMYCLHFIIEMAKGSSFEKFQKIRHTDKLMKKLRGIYFNKI